MCERVREIAREKQIGMERERETDRQMDRQRRRVRQKTERMVWVSTEADDWLLES